MCQLATLSHLEELSFSDPHWGACPVAGLCNYTTYVAVHLPCLASLDNKALTVEARAVAEATCMKKRMYYNMRIKTLRRTTANAHKQALQGFKVSDSKQTSAQI